MFKRFGHVCKPTDFEDLQPTDPKLIAKKSPIKKSLTNQMVFFPSSSDIFVENMPDYVNVCKKIIAQGHEVFFTTKPTMASITTFVSLFPVDQKEKIQVFVTISTDDDSVLRKFEPYTPLFEERIQVVRFLIQSGFHVNIMMEPYLSDPIRLLSKLPPGLNVAIGEMNYAAGMTVPAGRPPLDHKYLDDLYSDENVRRLYEFIKDKPNVYLKHHSIDHVLKLTSAGASGKA